MIGYTKISRASFYRRGGFANPRLVRLTRSRHWTYWERA
jgi:hypothetical protein